MLVRDAYMPFNSLFEIPGFFNRAGRHEVLAGLSILFLRFSTCIGVRWFCRETLSILFLRFLGHEHEAVIHDILHFQFSFWDSISLMAQKKRGLLRSFNSLFEILETRPPREYSSGLRTFNSLFEIPLSRIVLLLTLVLYSFQFSFWDSRFTWSSTRP